MLAYLGKRLLQMFPVLLIVTGFVFAMLWMMPGDPSRAFVGPGEVFDEQQLAVIRQEHHFDKPVAVQYSIWLGETVSGDLGRSVQTNRRVADELAQRALVTLGLGIAGVIICLLIALPAGILSAVYRGRLADYVRTARAKGMPNRVVIWIHTLRNALLPVITVIGMQVGHIFAGAVVIETLFGIPGMGRFLVQAIFERDFPVAQASVLVIALSVLAANLLTDLLCAWLDPRVKYGD